MNVRKLINLKEQGRRITAITAYDYSFATIAESANIDIILVGDSGAMVMFGYENTTPATMEEMLLMTKAVSRGAKKPLLVADMPFMSYHVSIEESIRNAGKFVKDSGMHAVKLEGDRDIAKTIRAITKTGIPVMAHIGLKPQTAKSWDGYKLQGTTYSSAKKLIEDAQELESAGAFCIVLEMVTKEISKLITENLSIPTIGIGSGQPSRLDSCKIASSKALEFLPEKLISSVAASDAFFPFPDGIEQLIESGVKAVIQPGGSINDKKVIKVANTAGIIMAFTGTRHFKH